MATVNTVLKVILLSARGKTERNHFKNYDENFSMRRADVTHCEGAGGAEGTRGAGGPLSYKIKPCKISRSEHKDQTRRAGKQPCPITAGPNARYKVAKSYILDSETPIMQLSKIILNSFFYSFARIDKNMMRIFGRELRETSIAMDTLNPMAASNIDYFARRPSSDLFKAKVEERSPPFENRSQRPRLPPYKIQR
ncbi:hypothetical protein EVAR_13621_1 [Eumeta japonica]|uniref:Uncharacterized protein n=1 Tax=Eumeta variegata TaxID=151549 RepID=A0A4C1UTD8_EUMVA|nr:hypothetical protein EVAR_13621_1 [Eumeta japonica]